MVGWGAPPWAPTQALGSVTLPRTPPPDDGRVGDPECAASLPGSRVRRAGTGAGPTAWPGSERRSAEPGEGPSPTHGHRALIPSPQLLWLLSKLPRE